jgi:nitrogen fixation/metabolism regulation signal transduction histidine kinase
MGKERRIHKFIDGGAQVRIATEIVLYAVAYVALLSVILFVPPFVNMFSNYTAEDHQAIAKELFDLNASKWPLFLLLALFIGVTSTLFSHRIVGPGYALSKGFHELLDRNLDVKIKLRQFDFLTELQDDFNKTTAQWREDLSALSKENQRALSLAHELASGKSEKAKELEKHLQSMETLLKSYRGV